MKDHEFDWRKAPYVYYSVIKDVPTDNKGDDPASGQPLGNGIGEWMFGDPLNFEGSTSRWDADYDMVCQDNTYGTMGHMMLTWIALAGLMIWTIGFVIFCSFLLWKRKKTLHETN